jgi:hypothetical protein
MIPNQLLRLVASFGNYFRAAKPEVILPAR